MKDLYKNILNEVNEEHKTNHLRERNSRVMVIDGLNTFIRSWTTNPTMNEDGDHTGGVVGSLKSIGYQIREFKSLNEIKVKWKKDRVFSPKLNKSLRNKLLQGWRQAIRKTLA